MTAPILVLPQKMVRSWPKHSNAKRWSCELPGAAFTRDYPDDAHFAAYSTPDHPYRLSTDAFSALPDGVRMALVVFDVDAPNHGDAAGAADEWWLGELPKLEALEAKHPGAFVYRTRGGYRVVFGVDVVLRGAVDLKTWKLRYCTWIAYLHREFGIKADPSCKDATRLYRLPFVRRDGRDERHATIGDASAIGPWVCSPSAEDEAAATRLERTRAPKPSARREERPAAPTVGEGILFHAFRARGAIGRNIGGKYLLRCPWSAEHTSGTDFDSSTVLYEPSPGNVYGWAHCSHAHCVGRSERDWLALFSAEELTAAREAAGVPPWEPAAQTARDDAGFGNLPTITLGPDERRVNDEVIAALAALPGLYQRSGRLTDVVFLDGRHITRDVPEPRVRELIASAARFVELRRDNETGDLVEVPAYVPQWCVRAVMARGIWEAIPNLRGIIDAPALRPDGSIIQTPGLDASGYLYLPAVDFPAVATAPSRDDAARAAGILLDVVSDFPFASDVYRAAWVAFVLTFFARPAFAGPAPLIAIDANVRAAGKGKCTDCAVIIGTGRPASKTPQPRDDDELRKRITGVLREGARCEVIDNVTRAIADGSFDALLTSDTWKDRLLGTQTTIELPALTIWAVNGNNLEFGADTSRRTLHVRLESPHENPEDRRDIARPEILEWVRAERPRLVHAALTILRSYFAAGLPNVGVRPWGSFEGWSRIVAGAVVWAGLPNPQTTRAELEATADTAKNALAALIDGWARLTAGTPDGVTVRRAVELLYPVERVRGQDTHDDGFLGLRDAIEFLVRTPAGKPPSPVQLGNQLRHFKHRPVGGRYLEPAGKDRKGFSTWRVRSAEGAEGAEGVSNPSRMPAHFKASTPRQTDDGQDCLGSLGTLGADTEGHAFSDLLGEAIQ